MAVAKTRILAASGGTRAAVGSNGYILADGGVRDIESAADAAAMAAAGAVVVLGTVGPTGTRPTSPAFGANHIDTSTNTVVWFDGQFWRDHKGARA